MEGQRIWNVDFGDCIDSPKLTHDCDVTGLEKKSQDVPPKLMKVICEHPSITSAHCGWRRQINTVDI